MKKKSPITFRNRLYKWLHLDSAPPVVRRVIVAVIGGTILLLGIAMIVLPGPAVVFVPLGLAILASEFVWARYWLRRAKKLMEQAKDMVKPSPKK